MKLSRIEAQHSRTPVCELSVVPWRSGHRMNVTSRVGAKSSSNYFEVSLHVCSMRAVDGEIGCLSLKKLGDIKVPKFSWLGCVVFLAMFSSSVRVPENRNYIIHASPITSHSIKPSGNSWNVRTCEARRCISVPGIRIPSHALVLIIDQILFLQCNTATCRREMQPSPRAEASLARWLTVRASWDAALLRSPPHADFQ